MRAVVAHAVALALDLDHRRLVQQAVEDRGGDRDLLEDLAQLAIPLLVLNTTLPC